MAKPPKNPVEKAVSKTRLVRIHRDWWKFFSLKAAANETSIREEIERLFREKHGDRST